ncbi:MAG TPA: hypothetical protein VFO08_21540 [Methylomirabilota bacterium]|nr:hypothetical protein [Methylomirabilota bacterium]
MFGLYGAGKAWAHSDMTFRDAQTGQPASSCAACGRAGFDVVEFHGGILVMRTIPVQHADGAGILSLVATPPAAIVRSWSARVTAAGADAHLDHFRSTVLSALRRRAGHRGVMVLRRSQDGLIGIAVLTLWTSMAAVSEFAGVDPHAAVVEPVARYVLADFNTRVEHFEPTLHAEP